MDLNPEKLKIIALPGNVLVTANPGTGKTLLLAGKYVDLIKKGVSPEDILCLTFTTKAKKEMEERILKLLKKDKLSLDVAKMNVFTFHAYALESLDEQQTVSVNLLRYVIFRYLKEHETLNYTDSYLVDTIVPRLENLMRYLKNYGIMPDQVDVKAAKAFLQDYKTYTKDDLAKFLEEFVKIFKHYEQVKAKRGIDYADMLLEFLKLKNTKKYKYVLVDELQDVNGIEADIALRSGENFFAVGDQKQAIFGFQGGSISNFKKFRNARKEVLSENFRSTNEILSYARAYYLSKTKEESHRDELKDLKNNEKAAGDKPVIFNIEKELQAKAAVSLVKKYSSKGQVAVIVRRNQQITEISKELTARDIEHTTTFFSGSEEAKTAIITFLKGVLGSELQLIRNAMFTPFFPMCLQDAFKFSKQEIEDLTPEDVFKACPGFKELRDKVKNIADINILFKEHILPIAISYGEDYLLAALSVQEACNEAINFLEEKTLDDFSTYLESSELLDNESDVEKKVVVTTVHKAKGKEFDTAIYIPSKTSDNTSFQDQVVKAILNSKGINAEEELEEESLRIDFVAMTRAKDRLFIITDKPSNYANEYAELKELELTSEEALSMSEAKHKAYALFVNKQFEEAKKLLVERKNWIRDFIKAHFENLDTISFSRLKQSAYEYLLDSILKVKESTPALNIGSEVHDYAEKTLKGEKPELKPKLKPYCDNVNTLISQIRKSYPKIEGAEIGFGLPISKIIPTNDTIRFTGLIDAVFSNNDEYLIVDWKTDKNKDYDSKHRQQLSVYRKVYSEMKGIPESKIKVAIGYVGLKNRINDGKTYYELDDRQPAASAFGTITSKIQTFLSWRQDVNKFFEDLKDEEINDSIWRSVIEEWGK